MTKVSFNKKNVFYANLKSEVYEYLDNNNLKKTGNWKLYSKALILISMAFLLYSLILFVRMPLAIFILLSCLLGFVLAGIGFNIMHDAIHRSYSSKKWVNNLLELTLNALGGNSYIYKRKHNIHHSYTNIDGIDDDIAKSPLMRQCSTQKWVPAHRYQYIYIVLVYAISSIAWISIMDFTKYFNQKVKNSRALKMSFNDHAIFWLSKILYFVFYLLIPVYFLGTGTWVIGFLSLNIVLGLTLAFVFQMAHVVEHVEFELAGTDPKVIESEWAIHQVRTTANFATGNKFIVWFAGGLNHQIEHHLFPGVSHIHYPAISKIVKKICKDYGVIYYSYPTFSKAVASHFRFMKKLGEKPEMLSAASPA